MVLMESCFGIWTALYLLIAQELPNFVCASTAATAKAPSHALDCAYMGADTHRNRCRNKHISVFSFSFSDSPPYPSPMLSSQPHFSCISLTGVTQYFRRFLITAPAASAKWTHLNEENQENVNGTQRQDKPVRFQLSQAVLIARQPSSQTASLCSWLTAGAYVKVWEKGNFISGFSQHTSPASAELWFRTLLSQTWYHCILQCLTFRNLPDFLSSLKRYHPWHPICPEFPS